MLLEGFGWGTWYSEHVEFSKTKDSCCQRIVISLQISLIFRTCVPAVLLPRWFANSQVTSFPNNRYMLTDWTTGVPQAMLMAQQHTQTSGDTHVPLPVPLAFYLRDADKSLPFTTANTSPFSSFTLQGKAQQPSCILLSGIIIIQPVKC